MDAIPNEILSEIFGALAAIASPRCIISARSFSECLRSVRNAHAIMLGTSSRWRALSLSNSHLWTTIPITRFDQGYIDTMRTRCGVHPLTILCWANHTSMRFMIAFEICPVSLWLFGRPTFDARDLRDMRIRELRIDGRLDYYFEKAIVLQHLHLLEGLRVHYAAVPHPIILPRNSLHRTLPVRKLDMLGQKLETLILHGVYKLTYTGTPTLSHVFALPHVRSLIISPLDSDVEDELPNFDALDALTLPSLQSLDLHTLQEWPTASTSTRSACRLTTLRLRLPHVKPHVLSVLMQCDETLVDVSLIGSREIHHDLPRTVLEYVAGEPSGSAETHQHLPHLRRLAVQTSSAQIEFLERMFLTRVLNWREMGVAMLESCRLLVEEQEDYTTCVWDGIRSFEDAGSVIQFECDR
ncbi:hypothetical protein BDZ89DRAFT_1066214 [Hymenopellis radicata]|nr:hypothetical protein BDZ89DRAFT_1066214 [Hymenopellis radicata]